MTQGSGYDPGKWLTLTLATGSPCSRSLSQMLPRAQPSLECKTEKEENEIDSFFKQLNTPDRSREKAKKQRDLGWSGQGIRVHPAKHERYTLCSGFQQYV